MLFVSRKDSLTSIGLSYEPNNQLNVCTTTVSEGEVAHVKLVYGGLLPTIGRFLLPVFILLNNS